MNNKRHLIALDLDGTLLTDKKEISPQSKAILKKLIDEGHIVVIATGRSHRTSIHYYEMLSLTTPIVNFNGAYIHHPHNKKWGFVHNPLARKAALEVLDACYQLNVNNIIAKVEDHIYIEKHNEELFNIFESLQSSKYFTPQIGNIKSALASDPTSLLIFPNEQDVSKLGTFLDDQQADFVEHRNWGAPWHVTEITKKGINKAVGLQKVANYYNIPQERIVAFGDEDNDLEMIDYAGVGVAMNNAIPELKSIANHITETNEEDGVRIFLEKYFKLNVTT